MLMTPEQAQDRPSPTIKEPCVASILSYKHIGIKRLPYTSALFFSPSSQDTSLNTEFPGRCLSGAQAVEGRLARPAGHGRVGLWERN